MRWFFPEQLVLVVACGFFQISELDQTFLFLTNQKRNLYLDSTPSQSESESVVDDGFSKEILSCNEPVVVHLMFALVWSSAFFKP